MRNISWVDCSLAEELSLAEANRARYIETPARLSAAWTRIIHCKFSSLNKVEEMVLQINPEIQHTRKEVSGQWLQTKNCEYEKQNQNKAAWT